MENKWYIGQPIVCIKTSPFNEIKKGQEFKIKMLKILPCGCGVIGIDVGVKYKYHSEITECSDCGKDFYYSGNLFSENRFAPLDQDISELTDILKEPIKELIEK